MTVRQMFVGGIYHVMTKSIAGYEIFRSDRDYERMVAMMKYYAYEKAPLKFSYYKTSKDRNRLYEKLEMNGVDKLVEIIAYCIMPTHIHFILSPIKDGGISKFMQNLLNSYTRYFNNKNNRKGPLWQGKFKSVLVENDAQLFHLTRYIHLNPTTSGLVENPIDWKYSSYSEYLGKSENSLCNFRKYMDFSPNSYKEFVDSRKEYQKELAFIKHVMLE